MAARPTRAETLARIVELRSEGLTYAQVAERLGMTRSSVSNVVSDPDGSKQRARRARYQGRCVECGAPPDGSNGRDRAPLRCLNCAQGVPFWTRVGPRPPDRRRRVAVRLVDIPVEERLVAARDACRVERVEEERAEILFAALWPSDTTYWVAA